VENGINIDPIPLSMEEFSFAGDPESDTPSPPFKNLHVRIRKQVVADGLDYSLDWQTAGYDMVSHTFENIQANSQGKHLFEFELLAPIGMA